MGEKIVKTKLFLKYFFLTSIVIMIVVFPMVYIEGELSRIIVGILLLTFFIIKGKMHKIHKILMSIILMVGVLLAFLLK